MPNSTRFCILLVALATSPYTVGYFVPGTVAVIRQTQRYTAVDKQKTAEAEHLDQIACGNIPPDGLVATTEGSQEIDAP